MNKELSLMLEDCLEKHKDTEVENIYLKIYDDYSDKNFQKIFAYFHQALNNLFEFLNTKAASNNHYNADSSRSLLQTIDELRDVVQATNNTNYKIIVDDEYVAKMKESQTFLKISGGSPIPDKFERVKLKKYKPIFRFKNNKSKTSHVEEYITTEASFDKNTISIVLRKEVFAHIKKLLNTGNYYNAVEESYKLVRKKLKSITGEEQAHKGFKEENYKLIFGHSPIDAVETDFFDGIKFLHMAIQKLRNEKAHKPAEDLDKNLAIHYIVLASLAYDLIDK